VAPGPRAGIRLSRPSSCRDTHGGESAATTGPAYPDPDLAACRRVLDRVPDQVVGDDAQGLGIAADLQLAPGLTLTADYYHIKIKDRVVGASTRATDQDRRDADERRARHD